MTMKLVYHLNKSTNRIVGSREYRIYLCAHWI